MGTPIPDRPGSPLLRRGPDDGESRSLNAPRAKGRTARRAGPLVRVRPNPSPSRMATG